MRHKVSFSLPERMLGPADIIVKVKQGNGNRILRKLLLSKGGIEWRRKNAKRGKKRNWGGFAKMMDSV